MAINPAAQNQWSQMTPEQQQNAMNMAQTPEQQAAITSAIGQNPRGSQQNNQNNQNNQDIFGDFNQNPTAGQNTSGVMNSSGQTTQTPTYQDLGDLNVRGANTQGRQTNQFQQRNDIVAGNLFSEGKTTIADIEEYLGSQAGFNEASEQDRQNTLQAIANRMGVLQQQSQQIEPGSAEDVSGVDPDTGKPSDGSWILGYDKLNDFEKQMLASMPGREQSIIDKLLEEDYSQAAAYMMKWKQTQEYMEDQRDRTLKIRGKEGEILEIERSQRLKDAERQLNNIKQNYAYLGSMGAPGISSTRIQAVADHIADAEQKFADMKRLEILTAEIRELGLEMDTANYEKQMQDLANQLNDNVDRAIQNALNDMSAADIAGNLDTVEGINKFRREMLENLDKRIDSYSTGTYNQLIQLNTFAQKQIDDAQMAYDNFQKGANTVNMEMSSVKGFYVDGNGKPIIGENGMQIAVPPQAPMKPIYQDGQLIQFSTDPTTGQIVADVTQVLDSPTFQQSTIGSIAQMVASGDMDIKTAEAILGSSVVNSPAFADAISSGKGSGGGVVGSYRQNKLQQITKKDPNAPDLDIDMQMGEQILSPISGRVTISEEQSNGNVQVQIQGSDNHVYTFNHLDASTLAKIKVGDSINIGDIVGFAGNTGMVKTKVNGEWVTLRDKDGTIPDTILANGKTPAQMLQEGAGSHLDLRVIGPDGKNLTSAQIQERLRGVGQEFTVPVMMQAMGFEPEVVERAKNAPRFNSLSPDEQTLVLKLANHDLDFKEMRRNMDRNPSLIHAITELVPEWKQGDYEVAQQYKRDWAKAGGPGKQLSKAGTVFAQAKRLSETIDALPAQIRNQSRNAIALRVAKEFGNEAATRFNADLEIYKAEMAGFLKGGTPTDQGMQAMGETLDMKGSKSQLLAAINAGMLGAWSKIENELETYYNYTGGKPYAPVTQEIDAWLQQEHGIDTQKYWKPGRGRQEGSSPTETTTEGGDNIDEYR